MAPYKKRKKEKIRKNETARRKDPKAKYKKFCGQRKENCWISPVCVGTSRCLPSL
jgi:hypothetical protein